MESWREARAGIAEYTATSERKNEADVVARESAQLEERRVELQEKLIELNQQINEQGFAQNALRPGGAGLGAYVSQLISQSNMIRMNLAETVSMQKAVRTDQATERKTLEAESKKSLEAAKAALTKLRESVDAVTKQYDELNSDPPVKLALQTLEKDKVGSFKLGPSPAFKTTVKALENAERTVLAKSVRRIPEEGKVEEVTPRHDFSLTYQRGAISR